MARKKAETIEELKNVYFIYGDEEVMAEDALKRLRKLLGEQSDADFNFEELDATSAGVEGIIDAAETIPLLSPRRLVVAREVDRLGKADQVRLASYLETPNPATTIVLVAHFPKSGESRDAKALKRIEGTPVYKASAAAGEILKYSIAGRGKQAKLETFVTDGFKKRGKIVDPEARNLLLEQVGKDLRDIEDAVERISLYAGDQASVTTEEVGLLAAPQAERDVFEFVDAVADRRRDLSLFLLNRLIGQGENPQRLFGLLLRQFRLISRVKGLANEHDFAEISRRVGIPPFVVGKCLQQSKKYSPERLRAVFGDFRRAQIELHSTKYLGEGEYQKSVLELLVARIIG
jgi:DNA polymerase-3 subunit delta